MNKSAPKCLSTVGGGCTGHPWCLVPSEGRMNRTISHQSPVGYATLRLPYCLVGKTIWSKVRGKVLKVNPLLRLGQPGSTNVTEDSWITMDGRLSGTELVCVVNSTNGSFFILFRSLFLSFTMISMPHYMYSHLCIIYKLGSIREWKGLMGFVALVPIEK